MYFDVPAFVDAVRRTQDLDEIVGGVDDLCFRRNAHCYGIGVRLKKIRAEFWNGSFEDQDDLHEYARFDASGALKDDVLTTLKMSVEECEY